MGRECRRTGPAGEGAGRRGGQWGRWGACRCQVLGALCRARRCCQPLANPHLGGGPKPFASVARCPQVGTSGYQSPSALGTSEGKGPHLRRLPALVELGGDAGQMSAGLGPAALPCKF